MIIAHLSDIHLRPEGRPGETAGNANALFSLAVAQINALRPRPDLVIVTGDIADHGDAETYSLARRLLAGLSVPVLLMSGAQDDRENLRAAFADNPYMPPTGPLHGVVTDCGPLRVIALDVTVPGYRHGELTTAAMEWLTTVLLQDPTRPTMIVMHQPPFATGIASFDPYRCSGEDRLKAVLADFPAVRTLACGQTHRFFLQRFGSVLACTAPSTSTDFALWLDPGSNPAAQIDPPAFLLHCWADTKGLTTYLVPIDVPAVAPTDTISAQAAAGVW